MDLRLGRWQDVLSDVGEVDAVITDPPYSARTHAGQRTGSETAKSTIHYQSLQPGDAADLAGWCAGRAKRWALVFSDHAGFSLWEAAFTAVGWYVFAPVAWVKSGATPRVAGDGPTSSLEYICVARPRRRLGAGRTGSRPGHYEVPLHLVKEAGHPGAKPLPLIRALVSDYTVPGDVIADPYAGSGTTLIAAATEGRRAIGAEMDPDTYAKARARLEKGHTPNMFAGAA